MSLDLRSLIGRLNNTCRRALEGAAGLCVSRTHYEVELEHWLVKLLEDPTGDVTRILRHFAIQPDRFGRNLEKALDRLKTGNSRQPALSPTIELLAREGWVQSSINFQQARVRSGALLLAALSDARLRRQLIDIDGDIRNINVEELQLRLPADRRRLVRGPGRRVDGRARPSASSPSPARRARARRPPRSTSSPSISRRARRRGRSIRCSGATSRSARSSTS